MPSSFSLLVAFFYFVRMVPGGTPVIFVFFFIFSHLCQRERTPPYRDPPSVPPAPQFFVPSGPVPFACQQVPSDSLYRECPTNALLIITSSSRTFLWADGDCRLVPTLHFFPPPASALLRHHEFETVIFFSFS